MFCIGDVPTFPGILERFSRPYKPLSMLHNTNSGQSSPAAAFTITLLLLSEIISFPFVLILRTSLSISEVSSMLLPNPITKISFSKLLECSSEICAVSVISTNCFAFASIPNVL